MLSIVPPTMKPSKYSSWNCELLLTEDSVEGGVGSDPATYSPNVAPRVPVHQVGNGNITPDVHFSESSPLDPNFPAQYQGQAGHATFASPSQAVGDYASAAEGANSAPATTFDISKLLNPVAHGVDINTLFENNDQAKLSISVTPNINLEDSTIPRTDDQKKAIVRAMCIAMASVDCAVDKKSVVKPFLEQKYSARLIEIACWRLLESMITRHDCGPLLRPFGVESKRRSHIKTFAERLEAILECLVVSPTKDSFFPVRADSTSDQQIHVQAPS